MAASKSRSRKTFAGPTAEEKIVASLIELMEAGPASWRRPWDGTGGGHHVNLLSGHRYRGANPILLTLGMHIRESALPFCCGFAEARKLGIFLRKGSKAVQILRPQLHSGEEPGEGGEVTLRSWASYRPVADREGRFLGVVPPTALITILRREHIEDLNLLAGLQHDHLRSLRALTEAPVQRATERLPWLLVGLAGSFLATWVVSRYEETLSRNVMVAFFMPAIVYLADAIGTQSEAIAVRGFSMNHVPLRRSIVGEIQTGFLIGSVLGLLSVPLVVIGFGSQRLALAVAFSIFAAGGMATSIGILLPWGLERLGRDPAFGSGPVATIIQDVLSLVIYFLMVQFLGV